MKGSIKALIIITIFGLFFGGWAAPGQASAWGGAQRSLQAGTPEPDTPYFSSAIETMRDGTPIERDTISGPPHPPPGYEMQRAVVALPAPDQALSTSSLAVPAYDWVFGCSAVSSAMIAGYYDNNGYPNMYAGPTNGGVAPYDSSPWSTWTDGYKTYPNNPLVASHQGIDGRANRGSIDDYWVMYLGGVEDPYLTNGWTPHSWGDAVGDFMKTSQSAYGNDDGSTSFYNWISSSSPLTCSDMVSGGVSTRDGTYGRKLFYEARGYTVTDCYNQKTDNNGGGFTFAMYKAEIDSGNPVLLNLKGHSIIGLGYDSATNTVYIHDTWDYLTHSLTWGGSYSGMLLQSVSIVHPAPLLPGAFSKSDPGNGASLQPANPTLSWGASGGASSYEYCTYKTGETPCSNWTNVGANLSAQLTGLESGAIYNWQVRSRNVSGITEANGGSWWQFTYSYPAPTITSFSPESGEIETVVDITGTNFTGATAVKFTDTPASFTVNSDTSISATVPPEAPSGKISVTTPGGTATSSSDFTVLTPVSIQFGSPTFTVNEGAVTALISVTLSAPSGQEVTIHYATGDGTAKASQDYVASSGDLKFGPGVTSQSISIQINDDALDEPDGENLLITLSDPQNASILDSQTATLSITDNDAPPQIRFSAAQAWVDESSGASSINVELSAPSGKTIMIGYSSGDGTASSGLDYTSVQGVLTFEPGQVSQSITVPVINDAYHEPLETFSLSLRDPSNVTPVSPSSIAVMIVDDDPWRAFIPSAIK
ncbi:MAG: IPT/TIG domain-containing protein [Chloroflexi bacterium]|nr:IPT/TIG domain-containing protein [Chloroflexota bacterium]